MKLYTFADNHDVNRLASQLEDQRCLEAVYTLVYLLPGIPSVYYGSEFGIRGRKEEGGDDALRPAVDLSGDFPHRELAGWLQLLSQVRREHPGIINGKYRELLLTNRQYAFARTGGADTVVAAVSNDGQPAELKIPVSALAGSEGACAEENRGSVRWLNAANGEELREENGELSVRLPACGAAVLIRC